MATTQNLFNGNGSDKNFEYTFPVLQDSEVKAEVDGVTSTAFSLLTSPTRVSFTTAPPAGTNNVRVFRDTNVETAKVIFQPGSAIKASDLNAVIEQMLFAAQEEQGQTVVTTQITNNAVTTEKIKDRTIIATDIATNTITANELAPDSVGTSELADNSVASANIINGSIVDQDISTGAEIQVNKLDDGAARQLIQTASDGTTVEWTDNIDIPGTLGVTSSAIFDSNVTIAGTTTAAAINASGAVGVDGNFDINTNKFTVAASSGNTTVAGTLAAGATTVTGNIVVSGTVDGRDVAADGTKLDSIDANATDDQTAAEIRALVEAASDSNVFTDADHSKLNAVEAGATADQTNAEIRAAVEAASDSNVFTDADHSKLNAIEANATADQTSTEIKALLASDNLTADHLAANSVGDSEIVTGALDNRYYTETELNAGQLDSRYYTETESDARYFNISTGDTIKDGDAFPDNDTTIATTAAINDRIIDLVDDVGGFVPIASETVFPNANPDVNNGAGTLVSVKSIGSTRTPSSGTVTISNGNVANNATVTITGCGSTVLTAGFGVIVETTSTLHTYAFHRLVPKATEVTTVAGNISNINAVAGNATNINAVAGNASNINTVAGNNTNVTNVGGSISNVNTVASNISDVNNFADLYQIASSNPSTDGGGNALAEGDLYFNTSADELKIYNGTAWQGGVTATGNFAAVTGNTFTGDNKYNDGVKLLLGTGSDLEVYHDATNNQIKSVNGKIVITTTAGNADIDLVPHAAGNVQLDGLTWPNSDGSSGQYLKTNGSGALSWSTVAVGGSAGTDYDDNVKVRWGTGNDLEIFHDGTNSRISNTTGKLMIKDDVIEFVRQADDTVSFKVDEGGATELYHNHSKKLETNATGITANGSIVPNADNTRHLGSASLQWSDVHIGNDLYIADNGEARFGEGNDLKIYHDGNHSYITNTTGDFTIAGNGDDLILQSADDILIRPTNGENGIVVIGDGSVELYYDNSKKFHTDSGGVYITGSCFANNTGSSNMAFSCTDNGRSAWGSGNDLQLYHDGSHSYVNHSGPGHLYIYGNGVNNVAIRANSAKESIICNNNSSVDLYHNNTKRFETVSDGIRWTGHCYANDNYKLRLGTGEDFQIFHDGTNSYLQNSTGNIAIEAKSGEMSIKCIPDGAVELYHNDSKKFGTISGGTNVPDGAYMYAGSDNDMAFGHNTYNYITYANAELRVTGDASNYIRLMPKSDETAALFKPNGAVELYYDNSKKFETTSTGTYFGGNLTASDNSRIQLGSAADLQFFHDGSNSYIQNKTGNLHITAQGVLYFYGGSDYAEYTAVFTDDGSAELRYDHATKIATSAGGVNITGECNATTKFTLPDGAKFISGNQDDLEVYHSGSSGYIANKTGDMHHQGAGAQYFSCGGLSSWRFWMNNSGFHPYANNTYDLGSSSYRWRNLYVYDMHFANSEERPNSVDGTWGDWTLQEGENDIFLLNNRSNKKYKMALTEVN